MIVLVKDVLMLIFVVDEVLKEFVVVMLGGVGFW